MLELRPPAVAGSFYPADPAELAAQVDAMLEAAPAGQGRRPKALIVPHAGYIYSGPTAAAAYARLLPFADRIARVVLIGPTHHVYVDGLAWPGARRLATPLGAVAVELDAVADLPAHAAAHAREHALETQLPFLQRVLPRATIVPLVGSRAAPAEVAALLARLAGSDDTLIVISSDLSHFHGYDAARARDARTADRIVARDATLAGEDACGAIGVNGVLALARARGLEVERIELCNSGDRTARSRDRVVGYGAFALHEAA